MDQVVLGKPKPKCSAGTSAQVLSGVLQYSVLGPLLFLAYINDMPETIIHSKIRLFADDTILFRAINGTIDSQLLQEDLTTLENWENRWQMSFNPSKCTVIRVAPNKSKTYSYQLPTSWPHTGDS